MLRKTQQLRVMQKKKKSSLQVELSEKMYTVNQLLSSEVKQDDKYIVIKLLNRNEEYKIVSFSSNNKLSEN